MTTHALPQPVGGKLLTRPYLLLLAIAVVGLVMMAWRFISGLGVTTAMSDGYPWGLWIAFDVVTGTALGAGGYALALLVYVLNKGKYHPLVRPAIVTTALGYSIAGFSIVLDVGRYWLIWKVPIQFWNWNLNSPLLEVAICIMSYMMVAWIEVSDSLLERFDVYEKRPWVAHLSKRVHKLLRMVLPFVIALGVLLPTMHQSSLGTLFVLNAKVDPMWHTRLLPLLFLVSCLAMGFGGVVLESALSHKAFHLRPEWPLLRRLGRIIAWLSLAWLALRLGDVLWRGALHSTRPMLLALFVLELTLFLLPSLLLLSPKSRDPGVVFGSAAMLIAGGALYRFDVYLVSYSPRGMWSYFPSVQEILITVGLVAIELAVYIFIAKKFPILSGRPLRSAA